MYIELFGSIFMQVEQFGSFLFQFNNLVVFMYIVKFGSFVLTLYTTVYI